MPHTPGPWEFVFGTQINAVNGEYVAEVIELFETSGDGTKHLVNDITLQGNGRLIAAAPELLEACKAVIDAWNDNSFSGKQICLIDKISQAVVKAEGK